MRGIDQLESYDFGAERKRLKSSDRCLFNRAKRVMDCCLLDKLSLARGQVPLNFDEGGFNVRRFATRAWALWGESQVSNDFPKIVDKIPDDRGWNRGKPGVNIVTLQRGVSESLRICLQSSYSRPCGGNRWLPLTAFVERRQGQVPLYIYNESPTRCRGSSLSYKYEFSSDSQYLN